jgi:hypothetical protein
MISPTLKKLRYRPGARIALHGAPAGFEAEVSSAKEVVRAKAGEKNLDVLQAFFTRRTDLERQLAPLKASLGPGAILWLCYPKGEALGTDLSRDVIREIAAKNGLKTVALVAVDEVWSALRVKRVAD